MVRIQDERDLEILRQISILLDNENQRLIDKTRRLNVRVGVDEASEGLREGDDSRSSTRVVRRLGHQGVKGLIGDAGEVLEKLPVSQEITPEHLGEGEGNEAVADVFEDLVSMEGAEGRRPLGTGRVYRSRYQACFHPRIPGGPKPLRNKLAIGVMPLTSWNGWWII